MNYSVNAQSFLKGALVPLYHELKAGNIVNGTVEIIDAHLTFYPDENCIMDLGTHRKGQRKYVENELRWYLSMDRQIHGHEGIETNPIWSKICSDSGRVNSNYGWCVFSPENGYGGGIGEGLSQYDFALRQLKEKPDGRQSVIFYSRPAMQWEWNDNVNAKSDFTCTFQTQHFIRNNHLDYIVYMRSNDAIRGLHCGDLPWHAYVYNRIINDLNDVNGLNTILSGRILWNAGSLHIYERDFELLTNIVEEWLEWNKNNRLTN